MLDEYPDFSVFYQVPYQSTLRNIVSNKCSLVKNDSDNHIGIQFTVASKYTIHFYVFEFNVVETKINVSCNNQDLKIPTEDVKISTKHHICIHESLWLNTISYITKTRPCNIQRFFNL